MTYNVFGGDIKPYSTSTGVSYAPLLSAHLVWLVIASHWFTGKSLAA